MARIRAGLATDRALDTEGLRLKKVDRLMLKKVDRLMLKKVDRLGLNQEAGLVSAAGPGVPSVRDQRGEASGPVQGQATGPSRRVESRRDPALEQVLEALVAAQGEGESQRIPHPITLVVGGRSGKRHQVLGPAQ